VSLGSSLDTKERVKQAIDIVDLVARHVPLRRQGRNYVGLCPWHDDTRPSLQVNPERQSFKCWVCDIGGDVFSFVMQIDGVTFAEALAMLAEQAGIPLDPKRQTSPAEGEGAQDKRSLYRAMAWAEKQYHECLLRDTEAEPARKYLRSRSISPQSTEKFHLGFSPNRGDWLLRRAQGAGAPARLLEAVGLLATPAGGGPPYDRFRGRLLFSIRDAQARPIGLGGRVLPESGATSPAKYINSPETPLFRKSEQLYGLDVARDAIRKSGTVLVMEGYTDCIAAHQFGFPSAVAVLGTALGSRHVQVLKRFADRIVLVLDGDEAGQRRANEVLQLFVSQEADLRVLTLPEGLDPCDFLLQHGPEAFGRLLADQTVDALEHKFRAATRGLDVERDAQGVHRAVEEMLSVVAAAPRLTGSTDAQRQHREWTMLNVLAMKFRIDEQALRLRLRELRSASQRRAGADRGAQAAPSRQQAARARDLAIDPTERELLQLAIRHAACLERARAAIRPEQLASAACRAIYEACLRLSDAGVPPTFDRLTLEFDDPAVKSLLMALDEEEGDKQQAPQTYSPEDTLSQLLQAIETRQQHKEFPAKKSVLAEHRLAGAQETEFVQRLVHEERARRGISEPTDG